MCKSNYSVCVCGMSKPSVTRSVRTGAWSRNSLDFLRSLFFYCISSKWDIVITGKILISKSQILQTRNSFWLTSIKIHVWNLGILDWVSSSKYNVLCILTLSMLSFLRIASSTRGVSMSFTWCQPTSNMSVFHLQTKFTFIRNPLIHWYISQTRVDLIWFSCEMTHSMSLKPGFKPRKWTP